MVGWVSILVEKLPIHWAFKSQMPHLRRHTIRPGLL